VCVCVCVCVSVCSVALLYRLLQRYTTLLFIFSINNIIHSRLTPLIAYAHRSSLMTHYSSLITMIYSTTVHKYCAGSMHELLGATASVSASASASVAVAVVE
jgi:hypothetical protein